MHEVYITAEPRLIQDTSPADQDYIAARVEEARLAEEEAKLVKADGSAGGVVDKVAAAAEERELARWAAAAGEASGVTSLALPCTRPAHVCCSMFKFYLKLKWGLIKP